MDNKKGVFSYRTRLVSTIYTQDSNLHALYHHRATDSLELYQQLSAVPRIPAHIRTQQMATLVTLLFRTINELSKPSFNRDRSGSISAAATKARSLSVVDSPG